MARNNCTPCNVTAAVPNAVKTLLLANRALGGAVRNVRCVRALQLPKTDLGIAGLSGPSGSSDPSRGPAVQGPRRYQRVVDAQMLIGHQLGRFGDRPHTARELANDALLEQELPVSQDDGVIPDRLIQRQAHESPGHRVEIEMHD